MEIFWQNSFFLLSFCATLRCVETKMARQITNHHRPKTMVIDDITLCFVFPYSTFTPVALYFLPLGSYEKNDRALFAL